MEGFVSNSTSRLDAKGRVSIPAAFRAVLARDGFDGLYVHPSLDEEAVDCGGNALLAEIHDLLGRLSPYSEERDMFSTVLLGTSEILKIDTEGRVILSESVKAHAGIYHRGHVRRAGQLNFKSGNRDVFSRIWRRPKAGCMILENSSVPDTWRRRFRRRDQHGARE